MGTLNSHELIASTAAIENGLDFAASAVEDMAGERLNRQKYAALHLFASIEILVKSRLAREHWTLTVADADKADFEDFKSGRLRSVGAVQGLKRLNLVSNLKLAQHHVEDVQAVEKLRNRTAHFALGGEPPEAVAATLARGLEFLLWFLDKHLRPGALPEESAAIDGLLDGISTKLGEIRSFVEARTKALVETLAALDLVVACPRCDQDALAIAGAMVRCHFCLYLATDGETGAEEYASASLGEDKYRTYKHGGEWPVHDCIHCMAQALVGGVIVVGRRDINWVCFSCGFSASAHGLAQCSACGALEEGALDEAEMCSACMTYYMSRE
ncbi:hypothetical protein [Pseudokineococcus lusitanus]|uniref:Uncharacterized protein n=1 Tax=Pseudokineococcus lusitanus TaxID=763993 RepID=A0A3N1GWL1_9ACTN|nr:hypothetical protein [Pseudokineococcus lusitanus]ROP34599.1 hypothetical protein EDC03_2415 [Pseudokineococcus lusitanus]